MLVIADPSSRRIPSSLPRLRLLALPPRGERDSGRGAVHRNLASNVQTNRQWEAVASGATRFNYPLACTAAAACESCPTREEP